MIYGRFGEELTIVRLGTIEDVQKFEGRKPDAKDREAVRLQSYVVVKDGERERLYHQAYLRADGGGPEVDAALKAVAGVSS